MGDVVDFVAAQMTGATRPNLRCPVCSSEWWEAPVVVDAASGVITGTGLLVCCAGCGNPPPVPALPRLPSPP